MALPTLILGAFKRTRVASLSSERRDALVISTLTPWAGYRGHDFRMDVRDRRMLVALLSVPGRVVRRSEMIDAAYGDDVGGGPENTNSSLGTIRQTLSFVCAMIGARLVRSNGGWSIDPADERVA
ncbi:helix-turn-helix domain-containing protein [Methylosinus sp. Sm6]|uniref:helix-turn-helix domain-containing protein n=1 Tax=Methylosinus sp. Sm6 TaxID=2866948 RepID=UPI001C998207|nr:helix-turn-helix domain-containing protein [Methylosinus sp. Sm6]MBY6244082.1 hypothetical protein [Methylosinus sp. Sm6]